MGGNTSGEGLFILTKKHRREIESLFLPLGIGRKKKGGCLKLMQSSLNQKGMPGDVLRKRWIRGRDAHDATEPLD